MTLQNKTNLTIGVPSKGRLSDPTLDLLKRAGLKFRRGTRSLYAHCKKNPITLVFVRAEDIPLLVAEGALDLGITGSDLVIEKKAKITELMDVGFGECKLSIAAPAKQIKDVKQLKNKRIATSFPIVTSKFFKEQKTPVKVFEVSGSVEVMIALGLADAIVDIVETGDTLRENGLEVVRDIDHYKTILIANKKIANDPKTKWLKKRIEGVVIADQYCLLEYNIHKKNIPAAEKIAPGFESPTISQLEEKDWFAIKVMVKMHEIHEVMDQLEDIGATAIMQTTINNCRL